MSPWLWLLETTEKKVQGKEGKKKQSRGTSTNADNACSRARDYKELGSIISRRRRLLQVMEATALATDCLDSGTETLYSRRPISQLKCGNSSIITVRLGQGIQVGGFPYDL
jgi:hypothetical protein